MKKLRLSQEHKLLCGVLGGLGEYLGIDPVVVRLVFIVFLVLTGFFPGVLLYLIAWVLIPHGTAFAPTKDADYTEVPPRDASGPADDSRSV